MVYTSHGGVSTFTSMRRLNEGAGLPGKELYHEPSHNPSIVHRVINYTGMDTLMSEALKLKNEPESLYNKL